MKNMGRSPSSAVRQKHGVGVQSFMWQKVIIFLLLVKKINLKVRLKPINLKWCF